jgi:hypothetical protein
MAGRQTQELERRQHLNRGQSLKWFACRCPGWWRQATQHDKLIARGPRKRTAVLARYATSSPSL